MATDNKQRAERLRAAAGILDDCEKWDAVAVDLRCEADELDPPAPEYADGLYIAAKYNEKDYWVLNQGIWSGSLWAATYTADEVDKLIEWRGPLTRVQVADDYHVLVPVVTLATNAVRSVANNMAPGSAAEAVLNAYAEAVEEAQARS